MGQQGGTSDQAKAMFDQGLSQMAYNVLLSKLPNVAPDVVTFKVLETDHEEGSGVGAFVIIRHGQTLYVPVVMADNQIKPLDILYYKDLNAFMPLSKEWLEELDKQSMNDMGKGVTPPKTMPTDVDIRNTVVPPTTGRYSYAEEKEAGLPKGMNPHSDSMYVRQRRLANELGQLAAKKKPGAQGLSAFGQIARQSSRDVLSPSTPEAAVKQAGRVFDEARNQTEPKLAFLDFLSKAPNRVKKAAAKMFETRPTMLKQAVWFYGEKPLVDALKLADYGGGIKNHGGALYVADDKTTSAEFKDIFGPKSPAAFQGVKVKGYYAKDDRKRVNRALAIQPYLDLHEPKDAGAYKLWKCDGKPVVALVIANPVNLFGDADGKRIPARNIRFRPSNEAPANQMQGHNSRYRVPGVDGRRDEFHVDRYVGITENGELIDATDLLGTQVAMSQLEGSAVFKKTVGDASAAGPRKGQKGIFVQRRGASFVATAPVTIEAIHSSGDEKCIEVLGAWGKKTLVINEKSPTSKLMVPANSNVVYMPSNFVWFPIKGELTSRDFLTTPKDIFNWTTDAMLSEGAEKVKVSKYTGENGFNISGEYVGDFVSALRKLATDAVIPVEDAEFALKQASEKGNYSFWIIEAEKFEKVAAKLSVAEEKEAGVPKQLGTVANTTYDADVRSFTSNRLNANKQGREYGKDLAVAQKAGFRKNPFTGSGGGDDYRKSSRGDLQRLAEKNSAEKQPEQPDPAEAAMAQMQQAQMQQPQGPSPVDMAVAEQMQSIQSQMQALTQMQQMVQTIQQRASMIASGGGAGAAPAAAAAAMGGPMDPAMMGAGAPVQGMGGQPQPGQDPNAQPQPGAQPGQPQPGQDPNAQMQQGQPQPGAQPGQDPNAQAQQQQQPPQAMMAADDGSVDTMQSQVNPQFIEQAGQLNDAGTFDAAALSSMAQTPSLKEMVAGYLPNLEKSLDNLGRVLLTLWMDEMRIKGDIGDDAFISLEENLRSTFRGMGDLILKINQNTLVLRDQNDHSVYQG